MKPKFSILTLLGITAYVSVLVAGFQKPVWITVSLWMIYTITAVLIIIAAGKPSSTSVFAKGMVLTLAIMAGPVYSGTPLGDIGRHVWFYLRGYYPMSSEELTNLYAVIIWQVYFVIGATIGCLALWHYRRQERRANQEKSGE